MSQDADLLLGAVAYDPKVVTIWTGFRDWFLRHDFGLDYVLYSHYERQVEDLVDGHIDAAWNSPPACAGPTRSAVRPCLTIISISPARRL